MDICYVRRLSTIFGGGDLLPFDLIFFRVEITLGPKTICEVFPIAATLANFQTSKSTDC
jgi:hypothetical protein